MANTKKSRPFNTEPYLPLPYGHGGIHEGEVRVDISYRVDGEDQTGILITYKIVQEPQDGTSLNIEDIYGCNTPRYMVMQCLRGPIFPYKNV